MKELKVPEIVDFEKFRSKRNLNPIYVHIQPNLDTSFTRMDLFNLIKKVGLSPMVENAEAKDEYYFNLFFYTRDLRKMWLFIWQNLYEDDKLGIWLKKVSIVCCEGQDGWNDYLLLWSPHSDEVIDVL